MEQLLTLDQAAELLNVSKSTLRTLIYDRRLASVRVGRVVRIRPSAVEEYLATTTWDVREGAAETERRNRQAKGGRELSEQDLRDDEREWMDAALGPTQVERREGLEDSEGPPFTPKRRTAGRDEGDES